MTKRQFNTDRTVQRVVNTLIEHIHPREDLFCSQTARIYTPKWAFGFASNTYNESNAYSLHLRIGISLQLSSKWVPPNKETHYDAAGVS